MENRINPRRRPMQSKAKPRFYPRHFTLNGRAIMGLTTAIKHVPADQQITTTSTGEPLDELKIGDLVIVGEKDTIKININGERFLIAYRNKLVKISDTK